MESLKNVLARIEELTVAAFGYLTAALLFCLMVVTCIDVTGRYFFNRPVYGGFELTGILLSLTIFFSLPLATRAGENITIDLLTLRNRKARVVQHAIVHLVGAGVMVGLSTQLWRLGGRLQTAGETTLQLTIPIGYVLYAMSALMVLTAVAFLIRAFRPDLGAET